VSFRALYDMTHNMWQDVSHTQKAEWEGGMGILWGHFQTIPISKKRKII